MAAKGIKVNQLAKELNVESKLILAKLRDEGLGDRAPNHMSVLGPGLEATVREWFSSQGGVATAVETAPHVDVATAKPKSRTRKKKEEAAAPAEGAEAAPATEEAAAAEVKKPRTRKKVSEPKPEPEHAQTAQEQTVQEETATAPAPVPVVAEAPTEPPAPSTPTVEVAPPAPAPAAAPEAAPMAPLPPAPATPPAAAAPAPAPAVEKPSPGTTLRRVTIAPTPAPAPQRAPITPAPKLQTLQPAKIQGPRVVRVEKEETIELRGPRGPRPLRPGQTDLPTTTRPRVGGGVKVDEEEESEAAKKAKSSRSLSSRRRGLDGRRGEAMEKLKEYTNVDLLERQERLAGATSYRTGFEGHLKQKDRSHGPAKSVVQRGEPVEIEEPITVRSLSAALGIKTNDIMGKLMKQGVFATINQSLDEDVAGAIALEYGLELRIQREQTIEEQLRSEFEAREVKQEDLQLRPAVVTILGHVDHGKTSLLDRIRKANVAAGEAGGITQHTGAWMVEVEDAEGKRRRVTFIDTPGHQAFTAMRARGASMTDVVVLVVSAAEGVQPQTVESINHARAAGVPIVVAMNKIDRPDSNPDMILGQLAKEGLNPVEWGGETEVVRTSATTGQGIAELIEILDYQAQLLELRSDPTAPARGTVIESRMDEGMGPVATVLVQDGTLHVGDVVLAGSAFGRVRSVLNDRGESIQEATASTPVIISGLSELPAAGEKVYQLADMERARTIAEERARQTRMTQLAQQNRVTSENLLATMTSAEAKTIHLIIKADVQGSVETLVNSLAGFGGSEEAKVRVVHSGVGAISESDVQLAMATRINPDDPGNPRPVAVIGFHVVPDDSARGLAEQNDIEIKLYKVIYEIFDDLKKALSGMLEPEVREKLHGHADIRQVFKVSRVGNIAGCMVTDGHIQRGSRIRLIRDGVVITEDLSIETLRRVKDDVREVKSGFECGIKLAGYDDVKVGDRLEAYVREMVQRTL